MHPDQLDRAMVGRTASSGAVFRCPIRAILALRCGSTGDGAVYPPAITLCIAGASGCALTALRAREPWGVKGVSAREPIRYDCAVRRSQAAGSLCGARFLPRGIGVVSLLALCEGR